MALGLAFLSTFGQRKWVERALLVDKLMQMRYGQAGIFDYFVAYSLISKISMALPIFYQLHEENEFRIYTMDKACYSYSAFILAPEHQFENGIIYSFDEPLKMQRLKIGDEGGQ